MDCSHEERDLLVCFGVTLAVAKAAQIVDPPRFRHLYCTWACPTSTHGQLHQLNQHFTGGAGGVGGRLPRNLVEMNETQMNSTDSTRLAGGGQRNAPMWKDHGLTSLQLSSPFSCQHNNSILYFFFVYMSCED